MERRHLSFSRPDAVQRHSVGKIITRFEEKGLKIVGLEQVVISEELAAKHYAPHKGKPFYEGLAAHDLVAGDRHGGQGKNAIDVARKMIGAAFGYKAEPGTTAAIWISSLFN